MRTPHHTLVQFSDVHIVAEGGLYDEGLDTLDQMRTALAEVEAADVAPTALLFTGDLTDNGDVRAYRRLLDLVAPAAARIGAPAVFGMGNHDRREGFREVLLADTPTDAPADHVLHVDGVRVIMMDSTTPGSDGGAFTGDQLDWLRTELDTTAPAGTVLAFHHPPIPSPLAFMDRIALAEPQRLAEVVAGTDVRIILNGHNHHATCGALAGIPVWAAPAVAYRADVFPPSGSYRGVTGVGYTRVDLYEGGATATFVPVGPATPVYSYDRVKVDAYLSKRQTA